MNKADKKLITFTLIGIMIIFIIFLISSDKTANIAIVYYENKEILKIKLDTKEEKEYQVDGYNGTVTLLAGNNKIKVQEEKSPLHLCSKQGYISKSYESIVCLPNKIIIKIESNEELDAIVK